MTVTKHYFQGAALLNIVIGSQDVPASIISDIGRSILSPKTLGVLEEAGYLTVKEVLCSFIVGNLQDYFFSMLADSYQAII